MTVSGSGVSERAAPNAEVREAGGLLLAAFDAAERAAVALPDEVPDVEAVRARLYAGVAALEGEALVDGAGLLRALEAVAAALPGEPGRGATAIGRVLRERLTSDDADALAAAAVAGAWEEVGALARRLGLDDAALRYLVDVAVRPALRAAAERAAGLVRESGWARGQCPACGARPSLAELRGPAQERVLRCGRCASAWAFARLRCPACGEGDHRRLGYLHAEGEERSRRVSYCESCRSALKEVATLEALDARGLAEMDLATAGLDFVAGERGYRVG